MIYYLIILKVLLFVSRVNIFVWDCKDVQTGDFNDGIERCGIGTAMLKHRIKPLENAHAIFPMIVIHTHFHS